MSAALFIKTDKKIEDKDFSAIICLIKKNKLKDFDFYHAKNQIDNFYFFDSMWVPFFHPLKDAYGKIPNYKYLAKVISTIVKIAEYLLTNNYKVKFFIDTIEPHEIIFKGNKTITLKDMDENCSFEWCVCYDVLAE